MLPSLLAIISVAMSVISHSSIVEILIRIKEINIMLFTIVAILFGFNMTSLSLIASFNRVALSNIFSKVEENNKGKALRQLLASFVYCVFILIGILIFGIFYNINLDDLIETQYLKYINDFSLNIIAFSFYFFFLSIIYHSFMVSVRNVMLIYKFILVSFKK